MSIVYIIILTVCIEAVCREPVVDFKKYTNVEVCNDQAFKNALTYTEQLSFDKDLLESSFVVKYKCEKSLVVLTSF